MTDFEHGYYFNASRHWIRVGIFREFVHLFWTECRRGIEKELNEALGVHWQLRFGMAMKCGHKILLSQENEVVRWLKKSYQRWEIYSDPLARHKGAF